MNDIIPRCFCIGSQPGHEKCPCEEGRLEYVRYNFAPHGCILSTRSGTDVPRPHVPSQQSPDGRHVIRQRDPATGRFVRVVVPQVVAAEFDCQAQLIHQQGQFVLLYRRVKKAQRRHDLWRSLTLLTFGLGMVVEALIWRVL